MPEILDMPFYDEDLLKLAFRFAHDVLFLTLVVRFALKPRDGTREFAFTAVMLNITVFFICFAMKKLDLGLGMALSLFAIFGVLRYRTDAIRTKEMTYLFIVIGIAVLNALANKNTSYLELLAVNFILVAATLLKERYLARNGKGIGANGGNDPNARKQEVEYDRLELLAPERREELLADLRQRTHLHIDQVRVGSIDLTKSRVSLTVW